MTSTNVLRDFSSHLTFRSCVECTTAPTCDCAENETCVETSRSCTACATTSCVAAASTSTSTPGGGGSDAGAIAGGVVGGIALIAIVTFLVWFFVIRKRRQAQAAEQASTVRHQRSRSMQSMASSIATRASNVIQIAYIPGVINRSPPETPGTLVPPVPPIPSTHASTYSGDQYLFTPRDLRDSRYSNATSDRRSIATSLARSSVATTIYRNDAIVNPIPALQARAGKAAVVSVKSANSTPSDSLSLNTIDTPAVPAITEAQLQKAGRVKPQLSSIVARSVVARPVNVKGSGSKPKVPTVTEEVDSDETDSVASHSRAKRMDNQDSKFDDSSDDDGSDEDEKAELSEAMAGSIQIGISNEGPFADAHSTATPTVTISTATSTIPSTTTEAVSTSRASLDGPTASNHRQRSSIGSNRMLENTIAQDDAGERSPSPFDDQHEVK